MYHIGVLMQPIHIITASVFVSFKQQVKILMKPIKMNINLNKKSFQAKFNSENGEVSTQTIFSYHQENEMIWANYKGGSIVKGNLIGKIVNDEYLEFVYHHINVDQEVMTGKCKSFPELLDDGKILLREVWQWTCKDFSEGESVLVEI